MLKRTVREIFEKVALGEGIKEEDKIMLVFHGKYTVSQVTRRDLNNSDVDWILDKVVRSFTIERNNDVSYIEETVMIMTEDYKGETYCSLE